MKIAKMKEHYNTLIKNIDFINNKIKVLKFAERPIDINKIHNYEDQLKKQNELLRDNYTVGRFGGASL